METFTIGLADQWWLRVLGRNPLIRRSDRIEALVVCLAVLLCVVAIPIAAAVGTAVHDVRMRYYAEQAQARHQVTATAGEDALVEFQPNHVSFSARTSWTFAGRKHADVVAWSDRVKSGDQQTIWVNDAGDDVGPPPSPRQATSDGIGAAFAAWSLVAAASAVSVYVVRRRLERWRFAQWDREITASRENNGTQHRE